MKWFAAALAAATLSVAVIGPAWAGDASGSNLTSHWSAPATTEIVRSDRTFSDGPVQLSGTLYAPASGSRLPVVVVFHAAQVPTRELPLYKHLTEMLPPLGVAVFVFDRRGSGASGGKPANGDYEALADDGIAALHMLAKDPRIDPKRIGFWGLSQGGWISLLAASRCPEAAFSVAISAPMTTPDVQMRFAVANILRIKGYPQADIDIAIAARQAVDGFERGKLDRKTAQARLDAAIAKPWFPLIYMDKTFHDPGQSGWAREIRHDPMTTLDAVKAPTLIIYGAADPWVPAKLSEDALAQHAAEHPNVTTVVVANADHDMMLSASPAQQVDPANLSGQAPEAPEYFAVLASWLTAHGIARAPGATTP
jgi:alpha-beta hydrolase superfamily lysophospholipase